MPPIRHFELAAAPAAEVIDGEIATEPPEPTRRVVGRKVDSGGRIYVVKHRYHVGRYLAGQTVAVESKDGLLHISHNGVVVATHARRHLPEDDALMDRRSRASKPSRPTVGGEVLRKVDPSGTVCFAGTGYRVGNPYRGQVVGVRVVGDTVQITLDGSLLRTHRARHDKTKELAALGKPNGKVRRARVDVA